MSKTNWTISLVEADDGSGDLVMPLPDDLLEGAGWKEGDTLNWIDNKNGTWSLVKVDPQLELFDEKDDAVLSLMKENSDLKHQVKNLQAELDDIKNTFLPDDWK